MAALKQQWIRLGLTIVVAALTLLFLGQATAYVLADALLPDMAAAGEGPVDRITPAFHEPFNATPILRRNIFDPQTGSVDGPRMDPRATADGGVSTEENVESIHDPNTPLGMCSGGPTLISTYEFIRDPEWSFAALQSGGDTLLYRIGMSIGDSRLLAIEATAVVIQPSGSPPCVLAMFDPEVTQSRSSSAPKPAAVAAQAASRKGNSAFSDKELEQGIQKVNESSFTVNRGLVDKLLENTEELIRVARVRPVKENNRVIGLQLFGIRRASVLRRIGLRNADVLRTINGYNMSDPGVALEAYTKLRTANHLTVSILRGGKPKTFEYRIR